VFTNNLVYNNLTSTYNYLMFFQDIYARYKSWRAFGTFDYNSYVSPRGWTDPFVYVSPAGGYALTLAQLRDSLAGQETNSTLGFYGTTGTDIVDSLLVNHSDVSAEYAITENYWKHPVTGSYYTTPVTLAPDSGIIMICDPITEIDTVLAAVRNGRSTGTDEALDYPRVGQSAGGSELQSGFEWASKVLDGKTIDSAFVYIKDAGGATNWTIADTVNIYVVDEDNPAAFNAADVHTIYGHFSAFVAGSPIIWNFTPSYNTWIKSPNIGALIQLAIDRVGFSDGNYIGVVITAKTPTTNNFWYGKDYTNDGVASAARLKVYYH
jgi:hypothetical protein